MIPMRWLVGLALVAISAAALAPLATAAEAPAVVWDRALGGTLDDEFTGIAPADGGFVLAGSTRSNDGNVLGNHGQGDAWAVRVDRSGQVLWQRPLGGTSLDDGAGLQPTGDGGFVLAANARSADGDVTLLQGGVDAWAVRLDGAGNLAWQRTYGGTLQDMAAAVALVPAGGHVLVGNTYSSNGNVTGGHGGSDASGDPP